jgi:hypothetical protein
MTALNGTSLSLERISRRGACFAGRQQCASHSSYGLCNRDHSPKALKFVCLILIIDV